MFRWSTQEEFLQSQFIRSHSLHSRHFYEGGLSSFRKFVDEEKIGEINNRSVYDVLNSFVLWNDKRGLRGKTINGYLHGVKKFLLYNDVKIEENRFKAKVSIPRSMMIEDQPLTIDQIRQLLTVGSPSPNMRALILVLLSSGMRLAEALNLKIRDAELESDPTRITIRAAYSKGKKERIVFISDEAREAVRAILFDLDHDAPRVRDMHGHLARPHKPASPDRYLFKYSGANIWDRERVAMVALVRIRKRAGMDQKFDDYKRPFGKIHFHLFRKFFLTKGADTIGEHAAHALCGHSFYMSTYYRKSEEERAQDYLKLMPKLTIFGNETVDKQEIELVARRGTLALLGFSEEEINALGDLSQYSLQDLKRISDEKKFQDLGLNGKSTQKIIPWSDVRQAITEGWELVSKLEGTSEAIVRLPK